MLQEKEIREDYGFLNIFKELEFNENIQFVIQVSIK